MDNRVILVVGDWSRDGHEITKEFLYDINITRQELQDAFREGSNIVGFNLTKTCDDYQDNILPIEYTQLLEDNGIYVNDRCLDPDMFANLYMEIAKLGNKNLLYIETWDDAQYINIGGYGLFDV